MADRNYTIKGNLDVSNILNALKQVRQAMSQAGAQNSMFTQVDKDIASADKMVQELLAHVQKGFSGSKDVQNFGKQFDKLDTVIAKIQVGLRQVNQAGNFNVNAAEVQKYRTQLDNLNSKQEDLVKTAKDSLTEQAKSLKLNDKEIKSITGEIKNQEQLEAAIKKVGQAKEEAARKSIGKQVAKSANAQSYAENVTVDANKYTYAATDRRGTHGGTDLRSGTGVTANRTVEASNVQSALTEEYSKVLKEIGNSGKTAADAVARLQAEMKKYGVAITSTDELQEDFTRDLNAMTNAATESGIKGQITRARNSMVLGQSNAQGEFELSEAGQNLVNNSDVQSLTQNLQQVEQITQQLESTLSSAMALAGQNVENFNQQLDRNVEAQENVRGAAHDTVQANLEWAEAQENVNNAFSNLQNTVKQILSIGSAWRLVKQAIQETFQDVKELDSAFASIAMVTDYSVSEMWDSYSDYADMAKNLGQETKSVIEASALFYQQGLDTNEALSLTEDTMKLATLAGLDFSTATSEMTAALRGFKLEMEEGSHVTDVYSELAANAAASVEDIAYAMSKTASIGV